MKRRSLAAALAAVLACCAAPLFARADLNSDIKSVLADRLLSRASVGVEVVRLGSSAKTSTLVYRLDSDIPLIPASNLKVVTTSAALDTLGADFRFRTLLVKRGSDLILIGDGDPTFGDAEFLKKFGWDSTTVFKNWAEALRRKGITRVGRVLVDDSVFETASLHPHWPTDHDQLSRRYSAEVGGMNLNANCVDFFMLVSGSSNLCGYRAVPPTDYLTVRNNCLAGGDNAINLTRQANTNNVALGGTCPTSTGVPVSVTVHDPSLFAATVLAETLKSSGVAVTGPVARDRSAREALIASMQTPAASTQPAASSEWQVLAVHETPLAHVLARANKDSMNLYAEALCKRLGFAAAAGQQPGSWQNGTAAVAAFLQQKAGVDPSEFQLDDGCGLSHDNHISPNAMVRVLMYDYFSPNRQAFMSSLSVAGIDGTLEHRFTNSDLRYRVYGKSGFVKGVSSLSGFFEARDGYWYAFSILMNGIPDLSNSAIKPLQEAIVRAVDANAGK
jgi:D-alanyl-D-alanine carboxypeptidase/D-alanyl-D-alanine-endopeptidase (penicillin-binding protein 4)